MKRIVTITAPSCSGKTHLVRRLVEKGGFIELVSHTTRPMRGGEMDGVDYYFCDNYELFDLEEYAEEVEFNGYHYGMSMSEIQRGFDSGKQPLIVCEPEGANQIAEVCFREGWVHLGIFLGNPFNVRMERFLERVKNDDKTDVAKYVGRLNAMYGEELIWEQRMEYAMKIDRYDQLNQSAVEDRIIKRLSMN